MCDETKKEELKIENVNTKVEKLKADLKKTQDKQKWYVLGAILLGLTLYLSPLCYMIKKDQDIDWPVAFTLSVVFIVWGVLILGLSSIFTRRKDDY